MPSPLTHLAAGYAVYQLARKCLPKHALGEIWKISGLFIFVAMLSILPDMDSVFGVLLQDFGSFHNQGSHSLIVGLGVAVIAAGIVRLMRKSSFWGWFLIALTAYEGHVILDYFTWGRGVMLFWPLSAERFKSPLLLFYGLHWSDGLFSLAHLVTVVTEAGLILLVYWGTRQAKKFSMKKEPSHDRTRIN
jgi:inner membrane protein